MNFPAESQKRPAPYEIIRMEGDSILGSIKRFPDLRYGHDNLALAFQSFIDTKGVIFIAGLPRSGKSFAVRNFDWQIENYQIGRHHPDFLKSLSWEDAEDKTREQGLIKTSNDKPFTPEELAYCNETATRMLADSVKKYRLTTFEVPAITSDDGLGRDIGTSTIQSMIERKQDFFGEEADFDIRGIGLIGGPLMQILMMYYRHDMKGTQTLEQGVEVAQMYGQPIPSNTEAWGYMKHEGASVEQIRLMERQLDRLLNKLEAESKIPSITPKYVNHIFDAFIKEENEKIDLPPKLVKRVLRREIRTAHLTKYQFEQKWGLESNHAGIFFNNPSLHDLYIPDIDALSARIAQRPIAA